MSKYAPLAMLLAAAGFCAASFASELSAKPRTDPGSGGSRYRVDCRPQCGGCRRTPCSCPDDYRPKCGPCVRPPHLCGRCDDYVPKSAPWICLPRYCGRCDPYDRKCAPLVCRPSQWPAYYKCPPAACQSIKQIGAPCAGSCREKTESVR